MRIVITGISGFIGSHLELKFLQSGYDVFGIDYCCSDEGRNTYRLDLLQDSIIPLLDQIKPDVIVHCAGLANVPYSVEYPEKDYEVNTYLVHKILFAMKSVGLADCKFVFLSSAAVYGQPQTLPIAENSIIKPLSPYALHKRLAEDICEYFISNYKFDIEICRIFSAYGPGLKKQIFWDMMNKFSSTGRLDFLGTGNESRDYIYIDDLTEALFLVSMQHKGEDHIWNIASGVETSIREVANCFAEKLGITSENISFNGHIRSCDPINWRADISRIKKIGFSPQTTIEEGIENYINWFKTDI